MCARNASKPPDPLAGSAIQLQALLEQVSDGIVVLDRDWRYAFINRAGAALFGRAPDELLGRHIWTEFPEGVGQPFHLAYERAMRTQEPAVIEEYYAPWDRWFENRIYPAPQALTILYHEITARKRAEHALGDALERLETTIAATGTGLWDWDLRTGKVRFSAAWKRQLGHAEHEIGDDFTEWQSRVHPDDVAPALGRIERFLEAPHRGFENEFRMRHRDGSWRWILARADVVSDASGAPVRMIGLHLDITERKREQLLLETQKAALRAIAEGAAPETVLDALARGIERVMPGALASVLLLDADGVHARHAAAPSLPAGFTHAIDGQAIGPRAGSCGTAMHRREPVVVTDIAVDPLWADYRDTAGAHGLRSCWSVPILDARGRVLGSFALYWREPRGPDEFELRAVSSAAYKAAIAITHAQQERELRASEAHARRLFEQANDAIHVVSADGHLIDVNQRAVEMLGYTRAELLRMKVDDLVPQDVRPQLQTTAEAAVVGMPFIAEWEHVRKDGTRIPVEVSSRRLEDGTYLAIIRDLRERHRAEAALRASFEQVRRLALGLERAREAERARLARELHDELGQLLTGIKMDVSWLTKRLAGDAGDVRERAAEMMKLLDEAVGVGRRIASELRPGVLDDLGLAAALRWLAREHERRYGVPVTADVPDELLVDPERATAAFRVAQEALTNVARHAGATRVELHAAIRDDALHLEVRDDGRGVTAAQRAGTASLGLLGMRERVTDWSGTLDVRARRRGGTTVEARIPLGHAG